MPVAYVGAAASLAGTIGGLVNSGSSPYGAGSVPGGYQVSNPAAADNAFQSIGGFYPGQEPGPNSIWGFARSAGPIANALANNPYSNAYQGVANQVASQGANWLSPMQQQGANQLQSAGNQIYQTAFDPQSALYNRTQQQVLDQANAINSMYGLSSSPYGAGVTNQALSNFNIDWQNNLLQRQLQGVQGAGQAYSGASGLGGSALNTLMTTGALPYSTYSGINNDILNAYGLGQGIDMNAINAAAEYMGLGQSGTQLAQRAALGNAGLAQQQYQNQQGSYAGLGQSLGGLETLFSNPGVSNFLSNNFGSGTGGYDPTGGGLFGYGETNMTYNQLLNGP